MREIRARIKMTAAIIAASFCFFRATPMVEEARADETRASVRKGYVCSIKEDSYDASKGYQEDFASKLLKGPSDVKKTAVTLLPYVTYPPESLYLDSSPADFGNVLVGVKPEISDSRGVVYNNVKVFEKEGLFLPGVPQGETILLYPQGNFLFTSEEARPFSTIMVVKAGICEQPSTTKGVFIRPCPGPLQLYDTNAFTATKKLKSSSLATTVGGGTLQSVCQDLRDSGVTDIFIPFKVDAQGTLDNNGDSLNCGSFGQLLYPSREFKKRVSKFVSDANKAGADPIGSIISVCTSVYGNAALRFHAWFPVFKDPYAAQIQDVKGKLKFSLADANNNNSVIGSIFGTVTGELDNLALPNDVYYTSNLFASPASAGVRAQELALLRDIVAMYPSLYGINLDYIRYPGRGEIIDVSKPGDTPSCIRDPRVNAIKNKDCSDIDAQYIAKRAIWYLNSDAVGTFVKSVRTAFPDKKLSVDVYGLGTLASIGQDKVPPLVDIIMPMAYTYFADDTDSSGIQQIILDYRFKYPLANVTPCIRGWKVSNPKSFGLLKDVNADITAVLQGGASGFSIFTYETLTGQTQETLTDLKPIIKY